MGEDQWPLADSKLRERDSQMMNSVWVLFCWHLPQSELSLSAAELERE
jgi:hypothetical protein